MARSTTTSPSPTFASTATAICRSRTSSPCSGRGRRLAAFLVPAISRLRVVLRLRYKTDQRLFAYASVIMAAVQVFFLMILNFAALPSPSARHDPRRRQWAEPAPAISRDGDPPPMLYLGYVGFTCLLPSRWARFIMKYPGEKMDSHYPPLDHGHWCFLTVGVFLGAHWAYAVLGWGGYWGWDPVENARSCPGSPARRFYIPSSCRKARHAEGLEHGAHLRHLSSFACSEPSSRDRV